MNYDITGLKVFVSKPSIADQSQIPYSFNGPLCIEEWEQLFLLSKIGTRDLLVDKQAYFWTNIILIMIWPSVILLNMG